MDSTISNLQEALKFSPDNIPLRLHLAETLLEANRLDEAEEEYRTISEFEENIKAKFGLAKVAFSKNEISLAIIILEEIVELKDVTYEMQLLLTWSYLKENSMDRAVDAYQRVLEINPDYYDEELDQKLKVTPENISQYDDDDEEDDIEEDFLESKFIQKPKINFDHVGGMNQVKKEIDLKIIQPLKHPELYKAYGKKMGGGILLYGPPGCGKTYMARATAGQVNARFINVSLNDVLDMWIGSSEKNLHSLFDLARRNTPCVMFFDEIDALGASRSDMKESAGKNIINQFLQELDGMENDNEGILVIGATNTPWHLDSAFRRPGRFDRIIFVPPPDEVARESILKLKLEGKPQEKINYSALAKKTNSYSGADIEAIIDIAIEEKLEEAIRDGIPKPIITKNLEKAIKKHNATTKEWFSSAKNYALYANESGLYDEILDYLKINK